MTQQLHRNVDGNMAKEDIAVTNMSPLEGMQGDVLQKNNLQCLLKHSLSPHRTQDLSAANAGVKNQIRRRPGYNHRLQTTSLVPSRIFDTLEQAPEKRRVEDRRSLSLTSLGYEPELYLQVQSRNPERIQKPPSLVDEGCVRSFPCHPERSGRYLNTVGNTQAKRATLSTAKKSKKKTRRHAIANTETYPRRHERSHTILSETKDKTNRRVCDNKCLRTAKEQRSGAIDNDARRSSPKIIRDSAPTSPAGGTAGFNESFSGFQSNVNLSRPPPTLSPRVPRRRSVAENNRELKGRLPALLYQSSPDVSDGASQKSQDYSPVVQRLAEKTNLLLDSFTPDKKWASRSLVKKRALRKRETASYRGERTTSKSSLLDDTSDGYGDWWFSFPDSHSNEKRDSQKNNSSSCTVERTVPLLVEEEKDEDEDDWWVNNDCSTCFGRTTTKTSSFSKKYIVLPASSIFPENFDLNTIDLTALKSDQVKALLLRKNAPSNETRNHNGRSRRRHSLMA